MQLTRRNILTGGVAGAGASLLSTATATTLWAETPQTASATNITGMHRVNIGELKVTALLDGFLDIDAQTYPQGDKDEQQRLMKKAFASTQKVRLTISCFAVQTGDKLVLIDTGVRDAFGPAAGQMMTNLKAARISPEDVDVILLTHMHLDHVGGMLTATGEAVFPNAHVYVAEADYKFWTSEELMAKAKTPILKASFVASQTIAKVYGNRLTQFSKDAEIINGISSVALPGHTPGHTGYIVSQGKDQMFMWGDLVHGSIFQFAHPEWAIAFDVDQQQAISTRKKIFDMIATDRLLVAGSHLPFPGFGHLATASTGYDYAPVDWQFSL